MIGYPFFYNDDLKNQMNFNSETIFKEIKSLYKNDFVKWFTIATLIFGGIIYSIYNFD